MSKYFLMFLVAFIMFAFAACGEDLKLCGEMNNGNIAEEVHHLDYDVEATEMETVVHNGLSRQIATFQVNVATESEEAVFLKVIRFQLWGEGTDKELAFYGALSNVRVMAYGEELGTYRFSAYEITLAEPVWVSREYGLELTIIADVSTPEEALSGMILVDHLLFGNTDEVGYDTIRWESSFDPYLGTSATAIYDFIDGIMMPNWQFPVVKIENCTEFEVQLEDGSCVYDNCQIMPNVCGYGDCRIDLQDGRLFCECDSGFSTTPGSDYPACNYRVAHYDVEFTEPRQRIVNNGSSVLLGEWQLFLTGGEDGHLQTLFLQMEGNQASFSSFQVTVELCFGGGGQTVFGDFGTAVQNDNPSLPYSSPETIDLLFLSNNDSYYLCENAGFPIVIRVYAEVHGNPGDYLSMKVKSAGIFSAEVFYEDGFPLGFEPDFQVGDDLMTSLDRQFPGWDSSQYGKLFPRVEIAE